MKWKKHAKRTATTTSAILLAIMLTACSDNIKSNGSPIPTEETEQGSVPNETLPGESGLLDPGSLTDDDTNQQPTENNSSSEQDDAAAPDESSDVVKEKGVYVGASDNHTIEIEVGQDVMALQIESEFQYIINDFQPNTPVEFEYTAKVFEDEDITQYWLTGIKETNE